VVEGTGLENRRDRKVTVGSNPTPSATEFSMGVPLPSRLRNPRFYWIGSYSNRDEPSPGVT
jgi:hypothetical protein